MGISPIGWTNDDDPALGGETPLERCLDEMAAAGYAGCELGGKFPRDARELARAVSARHLEVASGWCSVFYSQPDGEAETRDRLDQHLDLLAAVGASVAVVCDCGRAVQQLEAPVLAERPRFDEAEWHRLLAGLERAGTGARERGLLLVYHPHVGTGVQGQEEVDRLMAETDPELVALLFDSGHVRFAGDDPASALRAHRSRIRHVHLKDVRESVLERVRAEGWCFMDAVRGGVFTVPGDGAIDFRPLLTELLGSGYDGWLVVEAEQDPAKAPPLPYARRARRYLAEAAGL